MVDVYMSLMPLEVIGKEVYLQAKNLSMLLNDHEPKKHQNA
jgi:hypothetical protein